jgi:hypothetical protein
LPPPGVEVWQHPGVGSSQHSPVGVSVGETVGELVVGEPVGEVVGDEVVGEPVLHWKHEWWVPQSSVTVSTWSKESALE